MPFASTPGWLKKFLSSADKKEFTTLSGIDSKGMNSLFLKRIQQLTYYSLNRLY